MVIYVGNLSFDTSERDLSERFEPYGSVSAIHLLKDEISGNPLGFAFVEMEEESAAKQAIDSLDVDANLIDLCDCLVNSNFRCVPITTEGQLHAIASRGDVIQGILRVKNQAL